MVNAGVPPTFCSTSWILPAAWPGTGAGGAGFGVVTGGVGPLAAAPAGSAASRARAAQHAPSRREVVLMATILRGRAGEYRRLLDAGNDQARALAGPDHGCHAAERGHDQGQAAEPAPAGEARERQRVVERVRSHARVQRAAVAVEQAQPEA